MLPIAVRRFVHPPGPTAGATAPVPDNQTEFMDFFATANTACLGTETNASLRTDADRRQRLRFGQPRTAIRRNHGPIVAILGQGAQPSNGADFRGFIALDIRNFAGGRDPALLQRRHGLDQRQHAQGDGGELGHGRRLSRPDFPAGDHAARPERPGRDHDGQLDRHRRSTRCSTASRRATRSSSPSIRATSWRSLTSRSRRRRPSLADDGPVTASAHDEGRTEPGVHRHGRRLSTLADTLDPQNPMVTGTLGGAADHLHPQPGHAVAGLRHDRHALEHHDAGAVTGDLHHLGPGPGRQPVPHDQVPADRRSRSAPSLATSSIVRAHRSRSRRPRAIP